MTTRDRKIRIKTMLDSLVYLQGLRVSIDINTEADVVTLRFETMTQDQKRKLRRDLLRIGLDHVRIETLNETLK